MENITQEGVTAMQALAVGLRYPGGHTELARQLLNHRLWCAASTGNMNKLQELVEEGVDVNIADEVSIL